MAAANVEPLEQSPIHLEVALIVDEESKEIEDEGRIRNYFG